MSKAGRPFKEPLVVLPDDYGPRWRTRICLRNMKRSGASDLAITCVQNELDRLAKHINQAAAKARQAKRK